MERKDEKYVGFWLPLALKKKMLAKLKQRRKEGKPSTMTAFIINLIRNAVE